MANQIIVALPRVTDANGVAVSGAKALFYQTGTTTPVTVYSDEALSVAHASPLVADSGGHFAQVFYGGATAVKAVVKDASDVTLYTLDPAPMIIGASSAAENISFSPITGNAATEVQTAIANNTTALTAKVATSRTLTAGTGLTGGGDLSANRTFAIDEGDAAALTAGTDGKFPDCATIRADIDAKDTAWFTSSGNALSAGGTTGNLAHGLGAIPNVVVAELVCTTGEHGYTVGQVIQVPIGVDASNRGISIIKDATNIVARYGSGSGIMAYPHATTGAGSQLTFTSWTLTLRASVQ